MVNYLADTTVLIDLFRGDQRASEYIKTGQSAISHVTAAELFEGARNKQHLAKLKRAIDDLVTIPIEAAMSTLALNLIQSYFLSHHMEFMDALIAATAMEHNLTLVTANAKHFSFIKGLKLTDWKKTAIDKML
jgi:predicted nucleic acid-binding protein